MEVAPKGSSGSMSAPSKVVLGKDAKFVADMKKLFYKHNEVEDRELLKFKANEERVQGLSGNDTISLDDGDGTSEEVQGNNNNNQAFYSQASWGRLEMKPHEQKKTGTKQERKIREK
jgi:hypothetical protein